MSQIVLVGPGRAGMAIALAAVRAGHDVVGVLGRSGVAEAASKLGAAVLEWDIPLPEADLVIVAVRDDAIVEVARRIQPSTSSIVVHCSGATSIAVLDPVGSRGCAVGVMHPLQTLPDPQAGADALNGASFAVTAPIDVERMLFGFVESLGGRPFHLSDERRAAYHAGASAAANYVTAALAVSADLFDAAGVDFVHARPLVDSTVNNSFAGEPAAALTGPIARGDVGTVAAQRAAAAGVSADLDRAFARLGEATAIVAGRADEFRGVLDGDR